MLNHVKFNSLDDFFKGLESRPQRGVYFYRINGYSGEIGRFIRRYYEAARKRGVVIEGRIQNPNDKNLAYYDEMMGRAFELAPDFISSSLKKWLPRMNDNQRGSVADSIYGALLSMRAAGKNENMLKNAYIKFMCWLYYKFERIIGQLGENDPPKILYDGDISIYELMLLSILSNAGCDCLLLQYGGDSNYLRHDPGSLLSDDMPIADKERFPDGYSLKTVQLEAQEEIVRHGLYGKLPSVANCTNAWIQGKRPFEDILTPPAARGTDSRFFYNIFLRINGVEDKLTYANEIHELYKGLVGSGRMVAIQDGAIPGATNEEINSVKRHTDYKDKDQALKDLSGNIEYSANFELQRLMVKSFIDVMLDWGQESGISLNRFVNRSVCLICWIKRFPPLLFRNWKMPDIGCFIHMGGCANENEAAFMKFLSKLPVDVLILAPNLSAGCVLSDKWLFERTFPESLDLKVFPKEAADLHVGTSAYHAERDLDTLMYQGTGIYRDHQYAKADAVTLHTMFEEIKILWGEEVKYRPGFEVVSDVVKIPVIFSKISGVKDGNARGYWNAVKDLMCEEVLLVKAVPCIPEDEPNPMKAHAAEFLKNGRLQRERIKKHKSYPYGFLREETQEHMLDKLQVLIDKRMIKGIFENGTEYTAVATVLNLKNEILRKIQNFDFTKKNPKLIYINTGEKIIGLEDSILITFLNLLGFDILLLVPTGYQSVERYFNHSLMEEHQIGDYLYDLEVPNLESVLNGPGKSWFDIFFRR